ncbi:MAG: DUF1273 family protein [Clostridia bacterium]|nr:DUF1273 family protein [Clostridia bacterium]
METTLPADMCRENTCCFTGHRTIPKERDGEFRSGLSKIIKILCENGYRYFVCGGALGFDTMAAQAVTESAGDGLDARLILALPCRDQTEKWSSKPGSEEQIREYQRLKGLASAIVYISDVHTPDCMKERNQLMVDLSSFCIAYYRGNLRSGTGQTYRMAQKGGLSIYNLHDGSTSE